MHVRLWWCEFTSLPLSRLRWRIFSKAHSSLSLPKEPPAHQWHPQWDCGARCPLCGHHSPHAGPKEAGPVSDGAPGGWNTSLRLLWRQETWWWSTVFLGTCWVNDIYLWPLGELFLPLWFRENWKQNFSRSKIVIKTRREDFWKLLTHLMQS